MQKLDVESKPVGANCVRPHFEEITVKNQKGITLIALIITIIVMLILVGVTINVALNGGLFEKAETATKETEEKAILEEMLAMMNITDDGKIDYEAIHGEISKKYTVESYNYPNIKIKGKFGTYKYILSETEIRIGENNIDYSTELEKYFFADDGKGKEGLVRGGNEATEPITFIDDPNTIPKASEDLLFLTIGDGYMVVEYKGADYKIDIESCESAEEIVAKIGDDEQKITKLPNEVYPEGMTEEEIKIKQYFTGYSGEGRYIFNFLDIETMSFRGNNIIPEAASLITSINVDEDSMKITIEYNKTTKYIISGVNECMAATKVTKIEVYEQPRVYTNANGSMSLIEISTTEAIMYGHSNGYTIKMNVYECSDLTSIPGYTSGYKYENNDGIIYTRLVSDSYRPSGYVYSDSDDKWYIAGIVNDVIAVGDDVDYTLERNTTMTKAEIDSIIQAANATNE